MMTTFFQWFGHMVYLDHVSFFHITFKDVNKVLPRNSVEVHTNQNKIIGKRWRVRWIVTQSFTTDIFNKAIMGCYKTILKSLTSQFWGQRCFCQSVCLIQRRLPVVHRESFISNIPRCFLFLSFFLQSLSLPLSLLLFLIKKTGLIQNKVQCLFKV